MAEAEEKLKPLREILEDNSGTGGLRAKTASGRAG